MMGNDNSTQIANSGVNEGIIVAHNEGTIVLNSWRKSRMPSLISGVVKALALNIPENEFKDCEIDLLSFKPEEKILYNNVIKYKGIIMEYAAYYSYSEEILDAYDDSNMGSKAKILKCVKTWYLEEKGQLLLELKDQGLSEMEKIRNNADYLIDSVKNRVIKESNVSEAMGVEDVALGVTCFICYCFMECKILEKPL